MPLAKVNVPKANNTAFAKEIIPAAGLSSIPDELRKKGRLMDNK